MNIFEEAKQIRDLEKQLAEANKKLVKDAKEALEDMFGKRVKVSMIQECEALKDTYEGILRMVTKKGEVILQNYLEDEKHWGYGMSIPCKDLVSIELVEQ